MDHVREVWKRRRVRVAAVVLVLALLTIGLSDLATHLTDSVSVTARLSELVTPDGSIYFMSAPKQVFDTSIHDAATARRVRDIFDAARPIPPDATFGCPLGGNRVYIYDFWFSWRSISTETVHWSLDGCGFIQITTLRLPPTWSYFALAADQYRELVRLTGMPASPIYADQP